MNGMNGMIEAKKFKKRPVVIEAMQLIGAARELHYPVEIEPSDTICGECSYQLPNGSYLGKIVEWPCPTIRALGGEQG